MARALRMLLEGGFYHVYCRGNEQRPVFYEEEDRPLFLEILLECKRRFHVEIIAYCLMTNHVHLFLRTPQPNLSSFMARLLSVYALRFNWRHKRVGHLFQGRFEAKIVDHNSYLLVLSRYIHLNPWEAGMVEDPVDYPWSSLPQYLGYPAVRIADPELVLQQFSDVSAYREFVEAGKLEKRDIMSEVKAGAFLGSDEFVEEMKKKLGWTLDPDVARCKELQQRAVSEVMPVLSDYPKAVQIYALHHWAGWTQKAVRDLFGMSPAGVSQAISRLEARMGRDEGLAEKLRLVQLRVQRHLEGELDEAMSDLQEMGKVKT